MKFEELALSENIKRALQDCNYVDTTEIQEKTIANILEGKDLIGQSKTGTGKTAAYSLPMIEKIDATINEVQSIILCPTRELAIQVTEEIRKFTKYEKSIKCLAIYGGQSIEIQIKGLKRGPQIIVGTPGRVMDHIRRKTLKLHGIKMVILDEADEMLNMGFEEDIEVILKEIPEERQTILFSATMNNRILGITKKYLTNPVMVKIKAQELTVNNIDQISINLKSAMKDDAVMRLLDTYMPKKAIVFCNTKRKVDDLIENLKAKKYKAESLHGDIKQSQRDRIMKKLKNGDIQILVATDVAARGIDVDELELVVNYDIPMEEEYYVHRIGRTGRNGHIGKAVTFVVGKEKNKLYNIERYAHTRIKEGKLPTIDEINKIKNKKYIEEIQNIINEKSYSNKYIIEELLKNNDVTDIAYALAAVTYGKKEEERKPEKNIINFNQEGNIKLFLTLGKKDKIMPKDVVGSFTANSTISGEEIGKIKILDNFTFVEIPSIYANDVINGMQDGQIKGKSVNIEIANH